MAVVVTHNVPLPGSGFDATQPDGRAGATTSSKFSENAVHGGVLVAVDVGVGEGVAVAIGLGVAQAPQLPFTSNTMCMFGKPIAANVVGVVTPQAAALR